MSNNPNSLLVKNLVEFGLSEKEALVYISTLELELAGVNDIALKAGINRSSTYVVLESLKKKGLVGISDDKKVQKYVATPPEVLIQSVESRAKKQEEIKENLMKIVPELKALHKDTKEKPKVRVFEGEKGFMSAMGDMLNNKEKIMRVASSTQKLVEMMPEFIEEYSRMRISLEIKFIGILPDTLFSKRFVTDNPKFCKIAYIPKDKYIFPADMAIYDNKIGYMFSRGKKMTTIIIDSSEIAEVMKGIFDMAVEQAARLGRLEKDI
ncbi:MAG: hypothetical protein RJA61_132 [Candidatus Parcubacteria bacterium]|jgi:sugar-specific transcriptional regulator TrmB